MEKSEVSKNDVDEKRKSLQRERDLDAIKNVKEMIPELDNIFNIHGRVGNGTFSTVFLGSMKCEKLIPKNKRKLFAIKHLIPTSHPNRIIKELKCLVDIGGSDNVASINLCLRNNEYVAFVMPYIAHDRFQDYYNKMGIVEIQVYLRNLLIALRRVHAFMVIHRDIKPSNFLYNRQTGQFMLVDFGLAQNVIRRTEDLKRKSTTQIEGQSNAKICRYLSNSTTIGRFSGSSPLKSPLKQLNEIINSRSGTPNSVKLEPALSRHVKSAVLGVTLMNRLQERSRNSQTPDSQTAANVIDSIINASITNVNSKYDTNRPTNTPVKCCCYGKPQVCNICLVRKEIPGASRAGTPGYRPPEVLLKYTDQTTAVDMWAVGVIFISILSGVYPFFKAPDDFVALAEIVMLFGDEAIRKTAFTLGRHVTMSRKTKPLNLRKLCVRLKNSAKLDRSEIARKYEKNGQKCEECSNCQQVFYDCLCVNSKYKTESIGEDLFPSSAYDLLSKLLEVNPHKRITAVEALQHEFMTKKFD